MIRFITSSTHRHYQEAVAASRKVPGLESDLANVREQLETYQAQHREDQEQLEQIGRALAGLSKDFGGLEREHAALRRALDAVAAALVEADDAEGARREAAGLLLRHSDIAGLEQLTQPPRVYFYLYCGQIRSAHATYQGAVLAAEDDGAHPDGWYTPPSTDVADDSTPARFAIRGIPVQGAWPDRGQAYPLVLDDGRPCRVFGTAQAAQAAAARARSDFAAALWVAEVKVAAPAHAASAGTGLAT